MQKLLNFLLIVLIFTVLQVTNVGAQDTAAPGNQHMNPGMTAPWMTAPGMGMPHKDPQGSTFQEPNLDRGNDCQQGERYPDDHRCSNPQGSTFQEPNLNRGNDCQQGERYPDDHRCSNP
jgi:hypothetical protein